MTVDRVATNAQSQYLLSQIMKANTALDTTQAQVASGVFYPIALHLQECFAPLGHKAGDFPHAEHAAQEVLSLPMFPELRPEQIARVAESVS